MALKRRTFFLLATFLIVMITVSGLATLFLRAPSYLETRLIAALARHSGLEQIECDLRRIGLNGADFGSIKAGRGTARAIAADSVQIDYTLAGLYARTIDRILISGITLPVTIQDDQLALGGLDLKRLLAPSASSPASTPGQPIQLKTLAIRNATLVCRWNENDFRLPFELRANFENAAGKVECGLQLFPRGHLVQIEAETDPQFKNIHLKASADAVSLDRFADITRLVQNLTLSSRTNMTITTQADATECSGDFTISLRQAGQNTTHPSKLIDPLRWEGVFSAKLSADRQWEFNIQSPPQTPSSHETRLTAFIADDLTVSCGLPILEAAGAGSQTAGAFTCRVAIPDVRAKAKTGQITVPALNFDTRIDFSLLKAGIDQQTAFHLTALNTRCRNRDIDGEIAAVSFDGQWGHPAGKTDRLDGALTVKSGQLLDRRNQVQLGGIHLKLPLEWPAPQSGRKGNISVNSIDWKKRKIASLRGTLRQKGMGLIFNTDIATPLFPAISISATGQAEAALPERKIAQIRLNVSNPASAPEIDWSRLLPEAKGIKTSGAFTTETLFHIDAGGINGTLRASATDVTLRQTDTELAVEGIHLNLFMPDLPRLQSAPAQKLRFEKAALGNLAITGGDIDFQIESANSFLIEKGNFKWCDGNISSQAFRLQPGVEDYDLSLFCDRVNLAMLLEQLGVGIADGQGTLNGRIPVRFHRGKISFDDAFLYSTPGHGGKIHLTQTDILTSGIPPGTPQYNQLEMVREALKDFDYQWAKVSMLTQNDNLLLKLQFDGKPAGPLPFIYRKDLGSFVRIEAGGRGSEFKGIRLDANFNLPLDQILKYKDIYQKIN